MGNETLWFCKMATHSLGVRIQVGWFWNEEWYVFISGMHLIGTFQKHDETVLWLDYQSYNGVAGRC